MGISLILSSYKRPALLNLGLSSIVKQSVQDLEVIVVNDGINDGTERICAKYNHILDIRHIFSGQRNKDGDKPRPSGFALNIGIRKAKHDIIILSCPEIFHVNNAISAIVEPLKDNAHYLTIPKYMAFDETGSFTNHLLNGNPADINDCEFRDDHVLMPFLMGMHKKQILDIRGYDEDMTGYASEDNDLVDRLVLNGCTHHRVDANIIHLFHGKHKMQGTSWDNPEWAFNRKIYESKKGTVVRNVNREWGII